MSGRERGSGFSGFKESGTDPGGRLRFSVLIPAYNEAARIGRAIGSVREAMAAQGERVFEIVVCDNHSSDATGEVAAAAGAKVVFEPHNQIARARNAAARQACGEWLIFLDADSELSTDLLRETLKKMRSGRVGGGGARVAFDRSDLPWQVRAGVGFWNRVSRLMHWAAGSFLFCRRTAWEETGGFDEAWYAAEEIVFSRRLKRWCRERGLRFEIVTAASVRTSSRKIDAYSVWQMIRLLARLAIPGALKNRDRCGYWYERKEGKRRQ